MTSPSVALVVVGYESDAEWQGFFNAVIRSTVMPRSIVVVDNSVASSFDTARWPSLSVEVHHLPDNPGYGAAANYGVRQIQDDSEWIVICNPDTRLQSTTLEALLAEEQTFHHTAILGPAVLTSEGDLYPSAREIPGIRIGIGHALFSRMWPTNPWTAQYLGTYSDNHPRSVGWLSGSFLMVRRQVFEEIGGFDDQFFMFFEDVDLGRRIKRAGHRNVYVPGATISHSGAHATAPRQKEMILAHHASAERFLAKLYPRRLQWGLRLALRAGLRIRAAWATRQLD